MGVRLYPNTKNPTILEQIAGVPAGTYQRLQDIRAKHEAEQQPIRDAYPEARGDQKFQLGCQLREMKYRQNNEIWDDGDLRALDVYETFGFGKFKLPAHIRAAGGDENSGTITDPDLVQELAKVNNLYLNCELSLLEGFRWC